MLICQGVVASPPFIHVIGCSSTNETIRAAGFINSNSHVSETPIHSLTGSDHASGNTTSHGNTGVKTRHNPPVASTATPAREEGGKDDKDGINGIRVTSLPPAAPRPNPSGARNR